MRPASAAGRGFTGLAALLLAGAASLGSATAAPQLPSQDDVDEAWSHVEDTAERVAALEVQLAADAAAVETAEQEAAIASDAYNQAVADLEEAEAEADATAADAARADAEVVEASEEVARLATAAYRNDGGLTALEIFLSSTGVQDVLYRATTFDRLGGGA